MRRYNGMAPYPVRRSPLSLKGEMESCFSDCQQAIANELQRRLDGGGKAVRLPERSRRDREIVGRTVGEEGEQKAVHETMWRAFKRLVIEVLGNTGEPPPPRT